jgi:hypothetical protein
MCTAVLQFKSKFRYEFNRVIGDPLVLEFRPTEKKQITNQGIDYSSLLPCGLCVLFAALLNPLEGYDIT